jgi:hypothetical protein
MVAQKPLHRVTFSGFYVSNEFEGNRKAFRSNEFRYGTTSDGIRVTILGPREDSIHYSTTVYPAHGRKVCQ